MASSFTGNIDLEKPGIGEQSGVWGYSINTDMDKIDAAIGRVFELNVAGNPVITTNQTAVSQFDCAVLRLTGDISALATRTVTFPTGKQKRWDVDTYGVTFGDTKLILKVDGETNGVTITSITDKIIAVYSNGVSVRTKQQNVSPWLIDEIKMYAPRNGLNTANIPAGWYVCDGSNGTPDLRDRFIMGHPVPANYPTSAAGGAATQTINITGLNISGTVGATAITTAQMPAHAHHNIVDDIATTNVWSNNDSPMARESTAGGDTEYKIGPVALASQTWLGLGESVGGGQTHTHSLTLTANNPTATVNMNPKHYALIFIQYKGA